MAKNLDYAYCKAAPVLEWIGNKWTLVVFMKIAGNSPIRFGDLFRSIPFISEKMLSAVLHRLVVDGIIDRKLYPDVPPRVEYSVTAFGYTLLPHVEALAEWGKENSEQIMKNRKKQEKR